MRRAWMSLAVLFSMGCVPTGSGGAGDATLLAPTAGQPGEAGGDPPEPADASRAPPLGGATADLCDGPTCAAPPPHCEGATLLSYSGPGRCAPETGVCDLGEVEISLDCGAAGQRCTPAGCAEGDPCEGVTCPAPEPRCEQDAALTFTGAGRCRPEDGRCDFTAVEHREGCAGVGEICAAGACAPTTEELPVAALADAAHPQHPVEGAAVSVGGLVVTAVSAEGFFAQEPSGGASSGLFVQLADAPVVRGDGLDLRGTFATLFDRTPAIADPALSPLGPRALPSPERLSPAQAADPRWLSTLVRVDAPAVTDANPDAPRDFREFLVDDALRVDDLLYRLQPAPAVGERFEALTGVLGHSFGDFKLWPRDADDVLGRTAPECARDADCALPPPRCDDARTRRSFTARCAAGGCQVDPQLEACPGACSLGLCVVGGGVQISEVLYDASGADGGHEWVELYNGGPAPVDLADLSLASGGAQWTLVGTPRGALPPGGCVVIGGPDRDARNAAPRYDAILDFDPDLQNATDEAADGVALFPTADLPLDGTSTPLDAVLYGGANLNGLVGPEGGPAPVEAPDVDSGQSIERHAGGWRAQPTPTPGDCSPLR